MDAAAQPAGEAFPATPETPPLEPGARWKVLPYKLRKKIEAAAGLVLVALYMPALVVWTCLAGEAFVAKRLPPPEAKLLVTDAVGTVLAVGLAFLVFAGYLYLRYVSPNKAVLWDGIRGYYHKWRTHRNNARSAVAEMAADPSLRPSSDVRQVASSGRDALVFGLLACVFGIAAICLLACDLLGFFQGADGSSEPYSPGEVFALVAFLASAVLGFFALGRGGAFVSAWRRFVFASAKRGVLGWWREFRATDDWKRFVSIRPTFAFRRCALFAILLIALVWGTHLAVQRVVAFECEHRYSDTKNYLFTVCRTEPFGHFSVFECGTERIHYRISAKPEYPDAETLARWSDGTWYSANALDAIQRRCFERAQVAGWTGARMEAEIAGAAKDLERVRRLQPVTEDEFEACLQGVRAPGFSFARQDDGFVLKLNAQKKGYFFRNWGSVDNQQTFRVLSDGERLVILDSNEYREELGVFDFAQGRLSLGSIREKPLRESTAHAFPWISLPAFLAVFALAWSILLAPLFFLRFTYDPDKERAKQNAAASPAPVAPPST